MSIKELGMITIGKNCYSTNKKWVRRILNNIPLVLIFGDTSLQTVFQAIKTMKEDSMVSTETCSKKLKLRKPKLSIQGKIWIRSLENFKALVIQRQIKRRF